MTQITPLPWGVGQLDKHGQRIVQGEHTEICTCWHHSVQSIEQEMEANAAFIVKAVNAYDELVQFIKDVGEHFEGTDAPLGVSARKALAKVQS